MPSIRGPIPENIRRRMPLEVRADMGKAAMTNEEAQASRAARREKDLQYNIVCLLRQRDIAFLWQRTDKKATATRGWPDISFAVNGKAVAFEVKLPGERPTDEQLAVHQAMRRNGWTVFLTHSEQEALEQLEAVSG